MLNTLLREAFLMQHINPVCPTCSQRNTLTPCVPAPPVGLPSVQDLRVLNAELSSLLVEEVEQRLDALGQRTTVRYGKDGLKQVVHIRLENSLQRNDSHVTQRAVI